MCCFSDRDGGGDDMENKDTNTYEKNECIKWAVEDAVKGHSPISKAHVMSVLTHCMAAGYEAPTPMVDANGVLGDIKAEDLKEGDTLRIEEEVRLQFDTMKNEAGVEFMPLFTDEEELRRGNTTNVTLNVPIEMILMNGMTSERVAGVVINPFTQNFVMKINRAPQKITHDQYHQLARRNVDFALWPTGLYKKGKEFFDRMTLFDTGPLADYN